MWKSMNLGGKIGIVVGGIGGAAGIIAPTISILAGPGSWGSKVPGLVMMLFFVLVFVGVIFFVFRSIFGPMGKQQKLQKTGLPAEATILELHETGMTVNEIYPVVKMKLEVRPPGGQPYQAKLQTLVRRLDVSRFQPGTVVAVKYDPADPSNVVLAEAAEMDDAVFSPVAPGGLAPGGPAAGVPAAGGDAGASFSQKEQARRLEEFLKKNDDESEEILRTGNPAPAIIIQAMPLNVFVNGNNPAMTFILEVQPEGQASFQAQVTGVISEVSALKYQPGKTVFVKYDPADQSRVSLDHS